MNGQLRAAWIVTCAGKGCKASEVAEGSAAEAVAYLTRKGWIQTISAWYCPLCSRLTTHYRLVPAK